MSEQQTDTPRLVILISGRGSNMLSIINEVKQGTLTADIVAVISNKPEAAGLIAAQQAGINTEVVDHTAFDNRDAFDKALADRIDGYQPDLVILAGFMRILTPEFVTRFTNRLINIHPSLLPKYKGLNTHQRVIEAGEKQHGATVHFVTAELDDGPIIVQASVPVKEDDDIETLTKRVLAQEHKLYPQAIRQLTNQE